jgi:hypothetical protein
MQRLLPTAEDLLSASFLCARHDRLAVDRALYPRLLSSEVGHSVRVNTGRPPGILEIAQTLLGYAAIDSWVTTCLLP